MPLPDGLQPTPHVPPPELAVKHPIQRHYEDLMARGHYFGLASGPIQSCPDGEGAYQHFDGCSIYYHPKAGAHEVYGAIRGKWAELGWEGGLGYPTTDETATPAGGGRFNHFLRPADGGRASIYWTEATHAHAVTGAIRDAWEAAGWETTIGFPVADEADDDQGGRVVRFQSASIRTRDGRAVVTRRVKVETLRLSCGDTEDASGEDEFYLFGGLTDG